MCSSRAKCSFCFAHTHTHPHTPTHTHTCLPDSPPIASRSTDERRRKRAKNVRPRFGPRGGGPSFSAPSRSPVSRTTRGGRGGSSFVVVIVIICKRYTPIILYRSKTPTTRTLYYIMLYYYIIIMLLVWVLRYEYLMVPFCRRRRRRRRRRCADNDYNNIRADTRTHTPERGAIIRFQRESFVASGCCVHEPPLYMFYT